MLSRTASNLYWMSRYIERAENTARIIEVSHRMSMLTRDPALKSQEWFAPLNITGSLYPFSGRHNAVCGEQVMHFMSLDPENGGSIYNCIHQARENARAVRGSLTIEMWESINGFWLDISQYDPQRLEGDGATSFFEWVKERSQAFRGVTYSTMRRDDAFQFIGLGTHVERADDTARILDVKYHVLLPSVADVGGAVDYYQWSAVLRALSSFEAYRKVYKDVITPLRLAELVILRSDLPRSLRHSLERVNSILRIIQNDRCATTLRHAGRMLSELQFGTVDEIFEYGLHEYLTDFLTRANTLSQLIHDSFFSYQLQPTAA
jgi:uncharacterized alpha-E superfamily protein